MANVAFILADLYPDSEFIKPWQRARDAGYQTTVVGLRHGVDLERNVGADWVAGGGRGRNLITSRTPPTCARLRCTTGAAHVALSARRLVVRVDEEHNAGRSSRNGASASAL
jgi:putative intracellular protease/amidase